MVAIAASVSEKPVFDGVRWIFFLALSVLLNILILANVDIKYNVKVVEIPEQIRVSFRSLAGSASAPAPSEKVSTEAALPTSVPELSEPVAQIPEIKTPDPEPQTPVVTKTAQMDPVITQPQAIKALPLVAEKREQADPPKPVPEVDRVVAQAPRPKRKPRNMRITQPVKDPASQSIEKKKVLAKPLPEEKPVTETRLQPDRAIEIPEEIQKSSALEATSKQDTSKTDLNETGAGPSTIISEAQYKYRKPIVYPTQARRRGQQGQVKLHVLISENGRPMELKVAQSSGFSLLDKAALAAVKKWEFIPPVTNNKTQLSWVSVPVDFVLRR
ncbi:MAG: TonB family protein [Sneathiellales bacterium]|nr:TonB family protein [Sneathiellales bacterium]